MMRDFVFVFYVSIISSLSCLARLQSIRILAALRTRDRFPPYYTPTHMVPLSSSLRVGKYFQIPMSHSIPLCSILYIDLSFILFKLHGLRSVTVRYDPINQSALFFIQLFVQL